MAQEKYLENSKMKPATILYVIDNLARGGAETLLMGILPELNKRYNIIIVTLTDEYEFEPLELICNKKYSLGFSGKLSLLPSIFKLKRIIKETRPQLVHCHLFYSSIVARAACPPGIPLIYSLHSIMSKDAFKNSRLNLLLEKWSIKNNHTVIAVSDAVFEDYIKIIRHPLRSFILTNYVSANFFRENILPKNLPVSTGIKLVAVGNIKPVKNYGYLFKAFEHLKNLPIRLDIFGQGDASIMAGMQKQIDEKKLNIILMGRADNIADLLPRYDLYTMCSQHEGFGIAPVEAMAAGLPLLLSDLQVLRDVTFNNALFFNLNDEMDFVKLVNNILKNNYDLSNLSAKGITIAKDHYTKEIYLEKLFDIYTRILGGER